MNDAELGGVVRSLRHRRRWRQIDLGRRAGVSGGLVGLLERGRADRVSVRSLRRICAELELRLSWDAGYRGAELARLRDRDHSRLAEGFARRLEEIGWVVAAEVSFNRYGDRGRIDLLAHHADSRGVVVVEIKTVISDVQELLGALDVKRRVASGVATSRGWRADAVVPILVVAEGSTNRRRIGSHPRLFARLSVRGRAVEAWLRRPRGAPEGMLLFANPSDRSEADARRAGRQRIRPHGRGPSVDSQANERSGVRQRV